MSEIMLWLDTLRFSAVDVEYGRDRLPLLQQSIVELGVHEVVETKSVVRTLSKDLASDAGSKRELFDSINR